MRWGGGANVKRPETRLSSARCADVNFEKHSTRNQLRSCLLFHTFPLSKTVANEHSRNYLIDMSTPNKAGAGAKTMSSRLANMKVGLYITFMSKSKSRRTNTHIA